MESFPTVFVSKKITLILARLIFFVSFEYMILNSLWIELIHVTMNNTTIVQIIVLTLIA
jgi:hypothetical protein